MKKNIHVICMKNDKAGNFKKLCNTFKIYNLGKVVEDDYILVTSESFLKLLSGIFKDKGHSMNSHFVFVNFISRYANEYDFTYLKLEKNYEEE